MPEGEQFIECEACGAPVPIVIIIKNGGCTYCGHVRPMVTLSYTESLNLTETYKMKAVNHETGKKVAWSKGGDDLQRDTGRMLHLDRSFDKEKDEYKEHIVDPATGEVVRHVEEPLSKHTDRGAAKKK